MVKSLERIILGLSWEEFCYKRLEGIILSFMNIEDMEFGGYV